MTYGLPDSWVIGTARRLRTFARRGSRPSSSRSGMSFSFTFKNLTIYKPQLDYVLNNTRGDVGRYLQKRGILMTTAAKQQVGVNTGRLRQSIEMIHRRDSLSQYIKIGSSLEYALAHHEGTKPHIITPNDANILRFSAGGRVIYTHKVNHPGNRPNKYLSDQLPMVKI
jgi:hypothetical protein